MSGGLTLGDDDRELRKVQSQLRRPGDEDFELPDPGRRRDLRAEQAGREAAAREKERRDDDEDLQRELSEAEEEMSDDLAHEVEEPEPEVDTDALERGGAGGGSGSGAAGADIASATDTAIAAQNDGADEETAPDAEPEAPVAPTPAPQPEPTAEPEPEADWDESDDSDEPSVSPAETPRQQRTRHTVDQVSGRVSSDVMDTLVGRGIDMDSESRSQLRLPRSLITALKSMATAGLQRLYAARDQPLDQIPQFNQSDLVLSFLISQLGASYSGASEIQQDLVEVFSAGNPGLDAVDRRMQEMQDNQDRMSDDIDLIGQLGRANEALSNRLEVAVSYLLADAIGEVDISGVTADSVKLTQKSALSARKQLHKQSAALAKVERVEKGRPL